MSETLNTLPSKGRSEKVATMPWLAAGASPIERNVLKTPGKRNFQKIYTEIREERIFLEKIEKKILF